SGAMYSGVPKTTPDCVGRPLASGSRTLATPKSRIFTKSNCVSRSLTSWAPLSSFTRRMSSRFPSRELIRRVNDESGAHEVSERETQFDFVKILDFGVAKVREPDAKGRPTQSGVVFGTPEYMAPE